MDLSRHHPQFTANHRTTAAGMEPGEYLRLLHPPGSVGQPTMMQLDGETRHARTVAPDLLPWLADAWVDVSAYVTLNRYHGPRSYGRLAALNALYLDLDIHRSERFAGRDRAGISEEILAECARRRLPGPSLILDTGRGLAAIWLLDPLPPAALKRWRAAMDCLIGLFASWQADRACSDPARVFRVPGSINLKCGREVAVIGGSCRRYGFDDLADAIFVAAGRPTRAELAARKAEKETRSAPRKKSGGLSPAARFAQIRQDLDTLVRHWGSSVPEGLRNTWLHLHAACLTHIHDVDIAAEVDAAASRATPGLAASEVAAIVRSAVKAADRSDRRYHYSGARVAETSRRRRRPRPAARSPAGPFRGGAAPPPPGAGGRKASGAGSRAEGRVSRGEQDLLGQALGGVRVVAREMVSAGAAAARNNRVRRAGEEPSARPL